MMTFKITLKNIKTQELDIRRAKAANLDEAFKIASELVSDSEHLIACSVKPTSQTITIQKLADVLVASYKLSTKADHLQTCAAYRCLFNEDFYNEASEIAKAKIKAEGCEK